MIKGTQEKPLTVKQVIEGLPGINALMSARLPTKAAYAVGKLANAMQREMDDFNKAREKIFKAAGCTLLTRAGGNATEWTHIGRTEGTGDEQRVVPGEVIVDACLKEIEDGLLGAPVELNALPLDLEAFKDVDVPGNSFFGLDWAMKPEEPPK